MVFYDKHRSMFNYYNDIGMKYFTSMGISYSSEQILLSEYYVLSCRVLSYE